ncbi:MAG TPA: class I SAM-dependent methyltransferase [Candidatus Acidoferrum sp.]|nr:class I SAM-dependent methyltransferase [Candidatus Acidoferrum sp.]
MPDNALNTRVARFQSRLAEFRQRLTQCPGTEGDPAFVNTMQEFLRFIGNYDDREAYAVFEASGPLLEFRSFFAPCVLRFAWVMESRTYTELAAKMAPGDQKMGPRIDRSTWGSYARMEDAVKLVDFSDCRRLVVMGCGRAPCSLFYLHDWTNVECLVGIDRDRQSLEMAQRLVDGFGLRRVRLMEADACELDYCEFDVIYWGPFAAPRRNVMARVVATARPNSTVVLRDPFFTGTLLFEPMVRSLDPRLAIGASSEAYPGRFVLKHYVLRLKPLHLV